MIRYSFYLLTLFILISCNKRNCSDDVIGEVDFTEEARHWSELCKDGELVSFVETTSGDTLTLETQFAGDGRARICTNIICRPWDPFDSNGCEVLLAEQVYYTLSNTYLNLHLKVVIEQIEAESEDVYELLVIGLGEEFGYNDGGYILSNNFQDEPLSIDRISIVDTELTADTSFDLNGTTLEDIWKLEKNGVQVSISRSKGFVGFSYDGKTYILAE